MAERTQDMHYTMKSLPKEERPYEKFAHYGAVSLSDPELVAILLQTGTREYSSLELAREVLRMQEDYSVLALARKSFEELRAIPGIGPVKAMKLQCVAELSRRIHLCRSPERSAFATPSQIAEYYMESLRHQRREQLLAVYFDGGGCFIDDEVLSVGTVNSSLISPREIFFGAFEARAVYVILIHNHPSGNAKPSAEDVEVTKRLVVASEILGIPLIDHIVIGDKEYVSFREAGMIRFVES